MHSYTTPNLPLYKGLSTLLGKRKIHILHKIKVLPDSSPSAGHVPPVVLPWLGSGAGIGPLKVPKEIVLCLTIRLIHPMQISPAGKSLGDLEAKHEHWTHSGGLEKNADEGPSLQTLPVNATSAHRGRSEKSSPLQTCTTGR